MKNIYSFLWEIFVIVIWGGGTASLLIISLLYPLISHNFYSYLFIIPSLISYYFWKKEANKILN